jgi:hypothetical protein
MGERPSGFSLAVRTRVTADPDEISVLAERDIAGGGSADETTLLRGTMKAVLLPQHDGRVQIIVSRLGNIGEGLDYIVYLKNQQVIAKGQLDRDGTIAVDGRRGKPMLLKIEAPSAWFHLDVKGARFALSTAAQRRGIHFIGRYPTIYFYVPDEIGSFRLTISSPSTDQAAAADLVDPNGRIVASLDTSGKLASQVLAKREAPGGYWRLQWKRSWIPHMHNVWVQLDDRLAPWVVVSPQQALEIGASK